MKPTNKLAVTGAYIFGSIQIVRILVHFFPSTEPIQNELIGLTNMIIYGSKVLLAKKINN